MSPRKIKRLRRIVKEEKPIAVLLDAKREGDKLTGILFSGTLQYRNYCSLNAPKGEGYYLVPSQIRLFAKELRIRQDAGLGTLLVSFIDSSTRGTIFNKKIIGREESYGLAQEYAEPRKYFPNRFIEIDF